MTHETRRTRSADVEVAVTRTFDAPVADVYAAWVRPERFARWWVPRSMGLALASCSLDVRTGGRYRLSFAVADGELAFFGTYLQVEPERRLSWTNEEGGPDGPTTTVEFEPDGAATRVTLRERHVSPEALEAGLASGSLDALPESFAQLDALLAAPPSA